MSEGRRARAGANAATEGVVGVSSALLQELVQAFTYIADPQGTGDISTTRLTEDRLNRLVQSLGLKTSARDMMRDAGAKDLDFVAFRDMMVARIKQSDSEENIRSNFQKFETSKGSGKIATRDLKVALKKMGRIPLRDNELEEFLAIPGLENDGYVYYEKFMLEFFGEKSKSSAE